MICCPPPPPSHSPSPSPRLHAAADRDRVSVLPGAEGRSSLWRTLQTQSKIKRGSRGSTCPALLLCSRPLPLHCDRIIKPLCSYQTIIFNISILWSCSGNFKGNQLITAGEVFSIVNNCVLGGVFTFLIAVPVTHGDVQA